VDDLTKRIESEKKRRTGRVRVFGPVLVVVGLVAIAGVAGMATPSAIAQARETKTLYYVAMGDSLGAGTGASTVASRYVNVLYEHELERFPALQLNNLSCGGATTTSVINGPGCSFSTGTQLGDAEAFLRAHPKQIAFLTIDIGGNNVDGCQSGNSVNSSCIANGVQHLTTELPEILNGLESAYPGLAIYGMDYYDPFLGEWLNGPTGQQLATEWENELPALNSLLDQLYSAAGAAMADPATLFQSNDFAPTGSYLGQTEPQNVADVCNWTLFCSNSGNIHANDTGHALIAASFESVIDQLMVTTASLPNATIKERYAGRLAATGGHPRYRWDLAAGSGPLPPGMRLKSDGAFAGKPTTVGTYSFTVQATDSKLKIYQPPALNQALGTLSITVDN